MKSLMLTGATGFLGSYLLKSFIKDTLYDIVVLKRSTSDTLRIETELGEKRVISYDIDKIPLSDVFTKSTVDIIIHTATNYGRDNESITDIIETNLSFPLRLLQHGVECGLKVFINTDTVIDKRICKYSMSKSQFTEQFVEYSNHVKCINLRLEHFYGAFDNNSKFVSFVIQSLLNGVPSIDLTKGEQKRRFIYIDDVVDAFLFVLKNEESIPEGFNSFDISADISTTIKDFALLAKKLTGNTTTKLNFGALPYRADEVMDIRTDTQAIKSLGWKQKTSLEDGLTKMIQQERTLAT